jgi:hypothetical protein
LLGADNPQVEESPRIENSKRCRIDAGTYGDMERKPCEIRSFRQLMQQHHHQNRRNAGSQKMRYRQRQAEFRKADQKTDRRSRAC